MTTRAQATAARNAAAKEHGIDPTKTSFEAPRVGAGIGVLPAAQAYADMMADRDSYSDEERIEILRALKAACLYNPDPEELVTSEWGEAFEAASKEGSCTIN